MWMWWDVVVLIVQIGILALKDSRLFSKYSRLFLDWIASSRRKSNLQPALYSLLLQPLYISFSQSNTSAPEQFCLIPGTFSNFSTWNVSHLWKSPSSIQNQKQKYMTEVCKVSETLFLWCFLFLIICAIDALIERLITCRRHKHYM